MATVATRPRTDGKQVARSSPPVHVSKRDGELRIELAVPGYSLWQLSVGVEDQRVVVRGKRRPDRIDFERRFQLPAGVDPGRVHASLDEGVLTIRAPRAARTGRRTIEITSRFGINGGSAPI
jgi:HSP20 family protein